MVKWIVAEKAKAGLRHAVVCPNVTGRAKEGIAQSKRACAGSLALVANLYPPGVWFADVVTFFSSVTFVLFCFVSVFMFSLKPRPFVQSSFDAPIATRVSFFFVFLFLFGDVTFSEYFLHHFCFLFLVCCMERTSYVLSFRMVFFYLV